MGKIIAIVNQKGGVGKTTSSVNLASALGLLNKKVLLVDIDPQGNTTSGYGIAKRDNRLSTYSLLIGEHTADDIIVSTDFKNVDVMPSSKDLSGAEIELAALESRESRLKTALAPVRERYDYILMDCPPSLGLITLNALNASDTFIVPIQCEYYALEGLAQLMSTVRKVKQNFNPRLEIEGVLLTMYDGRLNLTQQVVKEVKKYFPRKVFATVIPRAVKLSEAPSYGQPIHYYEKNSKGAEAYTGVAREIIKTKG